jgi:hypothetical protein
MPRLSLWNRRVAELQPEPEPEPEPQPQHQHQHQHQPPAQASAGRFESPTVGASSPPSAARAERGHDDHPHGVYGAGGGAGTSGAEDALLLQMVRMETEPVFHGAVLGVVLAETRIPSLYAGTLVHLTEIMPGTDAATVPGLRVGQLMIKVNGRSILGVPYDQVLNSVRNRPVQLSFATSPHMMETPAKPSTLEEAVVLDHLQTSGGPESRGGSLGEPRAQPDRVDWLAQRMAEFGTSVAARVPRRDSLATT